uniref:Uncharacterized protein n=1 Tax=Trypanosoma congolense (strain IL3000) TaxID=1068625 RepID=G0UZX0_TRYCI|nr:hypothetical protein, unlikely [Trypanosoma congolense IL3000]
MLTMAIRVCPYESHVARVASERTLAALRYASFQLCSDSFLILLPSLHINSLSSHFAPHGTQRTHEQEISEWPGYRSLAHLRKGGNQRALTDRSLSASRSWGFGEGGR